MELRENLKKLTKKELLDNLGIFGIKMPQSALKERMVEGLADFIENRDNRAAVETVEKRAKLILGAMVYYGVMVPEDLAGILKLSGEELSVEELVDFVEKYYGLKGKISIADEEAKIYVWENVEDYKKILVELGKANTLGYNLLTASEYIRYSDYDYIGKIAGLEKIERAVGTQKVKTLVLDTKNDKTPTEVIQELLKGLTVRSQEDGEILVSETMKMMNNIPLWVLKGHSPNEIMAAFKERKIGRNEPCTCGSGKKYKKCCGK